MPVGAVAKENMADGTEEKEKRTVSSLVLRYHMKIDKEVFGGIGKILPH